MIAIVKTVNPVRALVRRNSQSEMLQIPGATKQPDMHALYGSLKIGDRIEVKRITNNPYLILVGME